MKKIVLALALLLLAVPAAYATEIETGTEIDRSSAVDPVPAVQATLLGEEPAEPSMDLETVQMEEVQQSEMAEESAQWPQRGSFWWIVGAIVVGGVILALLL